VESGEGKCALCVRRGAERERSSLPIFFNHPGHEQTTEIVERNNYAGMYGRFVVGC